MFKLKSSSFLENKYVIYFLVLISLSLLSIFPFFIVINKIFSKMYNDFFVLFCLFCQILIQLKFFLHVDFSIKNRLNLFFFIFVFFVGIVILFGSVWIMQNLNHNVFCMI
ncbi:MAG: cytochrome C oxidase subunit IV family protein [Buchnera aphidicola (Chaetogeoica yunlongensis)]